MQIEEVIAIAKTLRPDYIFQKAFKFGPLKYLVYEDTYFVSNQCWAEVLHLAGWKGGGSNG